VQEYWAEASQTWFWSNYGFKDPGFKDNGKYSSRPTIEGYDPAIYELLSRVYPDHHVPMDVYYAKDIHLQGTRAGKSPGQD